MTAKGLSKLIEECGELVQAAAKKLAYYTTDVHPDGAGSLKLRLENELADVRAASQLVIKNFGLDEGRIARRAQEKLATFEGWHRAADNNQHGVDAPTEPAP